MGSCLIWCVLNCLSLTWDPVPDADHYRITGPGLAVQTAATSYILPPGWEDKRVCVVAVDAAGNESVTPACVDGGPRRLEADCRGGCRQRKRGNPERKHYCEAWEVRP